MMGKTSPPLTRRKKRKKKGDDCNKDEGNDEKEEGCFVDEIAKRVKLCASITGKADDENDDTKVREGEDAFAATVLASTKSSSSSSYAEMNSVLKRVHFEAKERWERRRATARAETDGIMK